MAILKGETGRAASGQTEVGRAEGREVGIVYGLFVGVARIKLKSSETVFFAQIKVQKT
jgi:tetrahydromethanopterin S-methyltransferase subunit G